jgi:hypothetical protein
MFLLVSSPSLDNVNTKPLKIIKTKKVSDLKKSLWFQRIVFVKAAEFSAH